MGLNPRDGREFSANPSQGEPNEKFRSLFPPFTTSLIPCNVSYYPYGTGGPSETFAEMRHPVLDGQKPFDLYQRFLEFKRKRAV